MKLEIINIQAIKPYENNPRKNERAVEKVAESIRLFGFKNPVILDKNNVIVCGHTRVKAAEKLGITDIPCLYADDLTEDEIKAFRLIDNKTAEYSQWDFDKLELEWNEGIADMLEGFDFNIGNVDDYSFAEMDINENGLEVKKKAKQGGGKRKIPLTEEEYNALNKQIDDYIGENGVVFGFIRSLLK